MKKIWIDGLEANTPQRLGSSQVAFELIKNIEKVDLTNDYTVLLPSAPMEDMPKERDGFRYKVLKPRRLWTRIALPLALYLSKNRPDIFFTPTHYIPRFSPCKRVVTIFDLSFLHFPQMFTKKDLWQLTNWSEYSIMASDHIITISQFSKKDIVKNFKVPASKITVAYPGYGEKLYKPVKDREGIERVKEKYKINGDYVIFVGTVQPRKNIKRLIEAVGRIEGLNLVVVGKIGGLGKKGWMNEDIVNFPKELNVEKRVIFTDFIDEKDLLYLLNGARVFALPSLWEGFGIPVVDAMACGVPVVASDVSSLPEVVGSAGLLVKPTSVDQIEHAIRLIISDKRIRERLSKAALKQAQKFSWLKMTKQVIKQLENI